MPTVPENQQILDRLTRISRLTDRLAKSRDLVEQADIAERVQREIEAARQLLQTPE